MLGAELDTLNGSTASGHLLTTLGHADITLGQVIGEGDIVIEGLRTS